MLHGCFIRMMGLVAVEKARRTKLRVFIAKISHSLGDQERLSLHFSLTFSLLNTEHVISVPDFSVTVK